MDLIVTDDKGNEYRITKCNNTKSQVINKITEILSILSFSYKSKSSERSITF